MSLPPAPSAREVACCCGKFMLAEPLIVNAIQHEPLGPDGAFCGPCDKHAIRDLLARTAELEKSAASANRQGMIAAYREMAEWHEAKRHEYAEKVMPDHYGAHGESAVRCRSKMEEDDGR